MRVRLKITLKGTVGDSCVHSLRTGYELCFDVTTVVKCGSLISLLVFIAYLDFVLKMFRECFKDIQRRENETYCQRYCVP